MQRDGAPIRRTAEIPSAAETGYKDQNNSIHLLEAFTELYGVWKDPLLRQRLNEMLYLIRDKMISPRGNLILFFRPDWQPVSYRDSGKGHALEIANIVPTGLISIILVISAILNNCRAS
jgi:mannobiose 2-epimerase